MPGNLNVVRWEPTELDTVIHLDSQAHTRSEILDFSLYGPPLFSSLVRSRQSPSSRGIARTYCSERYHQSKCGDFAACIDETGVWISVRTITTDVRTLSVCSPYSVTRLLLLSRTRGASSAGLPGQIRGCTVSSCKETAFDEPRPCGNVPATIISRPSCLVGNDSLKLHYNPLLAPTLSKINGPQQDSAANREISSITPLPRRPDMPHFHTRPSTCQSEFNYVPQSLLTARAAS